jgi:hypothetical protein
LGLSNLLGLSDLQGPLDLSNPLRLPYRSAPSLDDVYLLNRRL